MPTSSFSSPVPHPYGFCSIRATTMAATLPVDSVWTRKTRRLHIASPRPLIAPRAALSSSLRAGWLLRCLSTCRPLVVSSSHRLIMPPLVVLSRQLVVTPSSLDVLSLHRPLVLSSCWLVVALHVVVVHRRHHRTPSNAAAISNTSATAAIECHLYRLPLPQLHSITTVKRQRPPSSIAAVKR